MGTARWDLAGIGRNKGGTVIGAYRTGGVHTTSTTASNLTDGAAGAGSAVTAGVGDILHIVCDEVARVQVGGTAATASAGYLLSPDEPRDIEISQGGTISVIDEA